MKKFISIFLLVLMFYNILGYYFTYRVMLQDAKDEMKNNIGNIDRNDDELIEIKFPYNNGIISDKDFNLIEEDEFEYQGNMYDVARSEIRNNYIYFYCINDSKEEEIDQQLNNHIQDNLTDSQTSQKKSNPIEKNLIKEYLGNKTFTLIFPPLNFPNYIFPKNNLATVWLDIESPPPESFNG